MLAKIVIFMCLAASLQAHVRHVDWMDKDMVEVRQYLREWLSEKPRKPELNCSEKDHEMAVKRTKLLGAEEGKRALAHLENLFLKGSDNVFFGLNETIRSIRGKKAHVILISNKKFVSVYDFRNFYTGRHEYIMCEGPNCLSNTGFSDGTDYGTFYLAKCYPLANFMRRFYEKHGIFLTAISVTNPFFESISSIGGIFRGSFSIWELPDKKMPPTGTYRKGFRHHVSETDYVEVNAN